MTIEIEIEVLTIQVRPSPQTNDHEVRLLGDGDDLIARFWEGMIGLDPDDLLLDPCLLEPSDGIHRATIARCECGILGCDSVDVEVRSGGGKVSWIDGERTLRFARDQYEAEVARARADTDWETPGRTAARLVRTTVDLVELARHGLSFQWASGRAGPRGFTASLRLDPGPHQILVTLPWTAERAEDMAASMVLLLRRDPRTWECVAYLPQATNIAPPAIGGPGWRRQGATPILLG